MHYAQQGLDNGILKDLCVVEVVESDAALTGHEYDVHDCLQVLETDISALQEQLSDTHHQVQLQVP